MADGCVNFVEPKISIDDENKNEIMIITSKLPNGPLGLELEPTKKNGKHSRGVRIRGWRSDDRFKNESRLPIGSVLHSIDGIPISSMNFQSAVELLRNSSTRLIKYYLQESSDKNSSSNTSKAAASQLLITEQRNTNSTFKTIEASHREPLTELALHDHRRFPGKSNFVGHDLQNESINEGVNDRLGETSESQSFISTSAVSYEQIQGSVPDVTKSLENCSTSKDSPVRSKKPSQNDFSRHNLESPSSTNDSPNTVIKKLRVKHRAQDGMILILNGQIEKKKRVLIASQEQAKQLAEQLQQKDNKIEELHKTLNDLKGHARGSDGQITLLKFQLKKSKHSAEHDQNIESPCAQSATDMVMKTYTSPDRQSWLLHFRKSQNFINSIKNRDIVDNDDMSDTSSNSSFDLLAQAYENPIAADTSRCWGRNEEGRLGLFEISTDEIIHPDATIQKEAIQVSDDVDLKQSQKVVSSSGGSTVEIEPVLQRLAMQERLNERLKAQMRAWVDAQIDAQCRLAQQEIMSTGISPSLTLKPSQLEGGSDSSTNSTEISKEMDMIHVMRKDELNNNFLDQNDFNQSVDMISMLESSLENCEDGILHSNHNESFQTNLSSEKCVISKLFPSPFLETRLELKNQNSEVFMKDYSSNTSIILKQAVGNCEGDNGDHDQDMIKKHDEETIPYDRKSFHSQIQETIENSEIVTETKYRYSRSNKETLSPEESAVNTGADPQKYSPMEILSLHSGKNSPGLLKSMFAGLVGTAQNTEKGFNNAGLKTRSSSQSPLQSATSATMLSRREHKERVETIAHSLPMVSANMLYQGSFMPEKDACAGKLSSSISISSKLGEPQSGVTAAPMQPRIVLNDNGLSSQPSVGVPKIRSIYHLQKDSDDCPIKDRISNELDAKNDPRNDMYEHFNLHQYQQFDNNTIYGTIDTATSNKCTICKKFFVCDDIKIQNGDQTMHTKCSPFHQMAQYHHPYPTSDKLLCNLDRGEYLSVKKNHMVYPKENGMSQPNLTESTKPVMKGVISSFNSVSSNINTLNNSDDDDPFPALAFAEHPESKVCDSRNTVIPNINQNHLELENISNRDGWRDYHFREHLKPERSSALTLDSSCMSTTRHTMRNRPKDFMEQRGISLCSNDNLNTYPCSRSHSVNRAQYKVKEVIVQGSPSIRDTGKNRSRSALTRSSNHFESFADYDSVAVPRFRDINIPDLNVHVPHFQFKKTHHPVHDSRRYSTTESSSEYMLGNKPEDFNNDSIYSSTKVRSAWKAWNQQQCMSNKIDRNSRAHREEFNEITYIPNLANQGPMSSSTDSGVNRKSDNDDKVKKFVTKEKCNMHPHPTHIHEHGIVATRNSSSSTSSSNTLVPTTLSIPLPSTVTPVSVSTSILSPSSFRQQITRLRAENYMIRDDILKFKGTMKKLRDDEKVGSTFAYL